MAITKTRHEAAAERLRQAILHGRYQPGQRLKQQELAREFGCSVIPIREALHQLAVEGFVVLDPQKGARVATMDSRTLEEVYEVRILLEGLATRRAVERMTPEAIARIRVILEKMDRPDLSPSEWLALNWEFHNSIYVCADQEFLRKMISNLRLTLETYLRLDLAKLTQYSQGRREHRRIFRACLRGDAKAAARHTEAHLRRVALGLVRYLRQFGK
jgi:DNA-binding GntR family transcriptional regulator